MSIWSLVNQKIAQHRQMQQQQPQPQMPQLGGFWGSIQNKLQMPGMGQEPQFGGQGQFAGMPEPQAYPWMQQKKQPVMKFGGNPNIQMPTHQPGNWDNWGRPGTPQ